MTTSFSAGQWYVQRFSDQDLHFFVKDFAKNGNARGVLVTSYKHSRARPKAKASTAPASYATLWTKASHVPGDVVAAMLEKMG